MADVLSIFDFDDTLVESDARVHVTHSDGTTSSLSSEKYAKYKAAPGDTFDFSEFEGYPPNGRLIAPTFRRLRLALQHGNDVVVLTARGNPEPVQEYLRDSGVGVEVVAVGSSDPMAKAAYVLGRVKSGGYEVVNVYEDNARNIRAIRRVVTVEGVKFNSTRVKAGTLQEARLWDRVMSEAKNKPAGAGCVVVKRIDGVDHVLLLRSTLGGWDLPKGRLDPNEDTYRCAIRETGEEASISDLTFEWGRQPYVDRHLTFYLARTEQDPNPVVNPHSGILEHSHGIWVLPGDAIGMLPGYLARAVRWAQGVILGYCQQ